MRWRLWSSALLWVVSLGVLAGCTARGHPARPVPTELVLAPQPARRLVVVLPGRGDDLRALRRSGVVEAIHGSWPDTDVLLAELSLPYYLDGLQAARRLHDDVIAPTRPRGYREVWLSGASLGGLGTLLYAQAYPDELDGLVLLAPFLGDRAILDEIAAAGGAARWEAGPAQALTPDTWQREFWRRLQGWLHEPANACRVWLAYGERDRLRQAMPLLTPLLPPGHVLVRPGGHTWKVWTPALREVLDAASKERADLRRDEVPNVCVPHPRVRNPGTGHGRRAPLTRLDSSGTNSSGTR